MDIQSEEFEGLLGEALRAGPGTPAWRQAVDVLRDAGEKGEEFAMLCRAREDLASGREYRTVRAGPGFTQKLLANIERDQEKQWNLPTANIVATIAVMIVALSVVIGAWLLFSPAKNVRSDAELLDTYFINTILSEDFTADPPAGLSRIGVLPVLVEGGARVQVQTRTTEKHVGGGFVTRQAIAADEAIAVESTIEIDRADTDLITQVFISDRPDFAADTGLSPHEFVALIESGRVRVVLPNGKTAQDASLAQATGSVTLRVRLNRDSAVVEVDGKTLWSGQHHLSPEHVRFAGVRFLARGGERSTGVTIKTLKLIEP